MNIKCMFDVRFRCSLLPPVWQEMSTWSVLTPNVSDSICPASLVSNRHLFLLQLVMEIICLAGAETQHETSTSNKICCQERGLQDLSPFRRMKKKALNIGRKSAEGPMSPPKTHEIKLGWVHFWTFYVFLGIMCTVPIQYVFNMFMVYRQKKNWAWFNPNLYFSTLFLCFFSQLPLVELIGGIFAYYFAYFLFLALFLHNFPKLKIFL